VHWDRQRGLWKARLNANGKQYYFGHYASPKDAYQAILDNSSTVHGAFAYEGK